MTVHMIGCAGSCGLAVLAEDVESCGWSFLHITNRWRCGACTRELATVQSHLVSDSGADNLPPHSIGALKKLPETPPLREEVKS